MDKQTRSHTNILPLSLIAIAISSTTLAQSNTNPPTPAPSKTPTQQIQEPQATQSTPNQNTEPLTQANLTTLTGNIQRPNAILWHDNKLYVSCSGDWTLYEINTVTSTTVQYIYGVRNAHTLYAENNTEGELNLWIPDYETNSIIHIDHNGLETTATNLNRPWGIAPLNESQFIVTNLLGNNAISISRNGETREALTNLRSPTGIATDEEYIYIANTGSARRAIEWFSIIDIERSNTPINTSTTEGTNTLITGLQNVTDVTLADDGRLYFAYALGTRGVIGRIAPENCREGGCTHDQVEIIIYTELAAPLAGLTISPDMRLFIHSMFSPDIYWVQLNS